MNRFRSVSHEKPPPHLTNSEIPHIMWLNGADAVKQRHRRRREEVAVPKTRTESGRQVRGARESIGEYISELCTEHAGTHIRLIRRIPLPQSVGCNDRHPLACPGQAK